MKKNQYGFTIVEGLLILVAVTLIGFVGFYVYNANKESNKNQADSSIVKQEKKAPEQTTKTVEFIDFKELGVKIQSSDKLTGLTYKTEPDNPYLYLTTSELTTLIKGCNKPGTELTATSAAFMTLGKKAGQYPETQTVDSGSLLKQFPEFYISAGYPNGLTHPSDCQDHDKIQALMGSLKTAVGESFKNAELIQ